MTDCRELTPEELDQICGGIIILDGDVYMALSDDATLLVAASCLDVGKAKAVARQYGWSDEVLSPKEFAKRYGREYNGDDYWYQNDQGYWEYDDPSNWMWPDW